MANDIVKAISANDIKNGSNVVKVWDGAPKNNNASNRGVVGLNTPAIGDIQDKYDNRFDDVGYYT